MNKLYTRCEGGKEPDWSRYTRLEISGSKYKSGRTEVMIFAHDLAPDALRHPANSS